MMRSILILLVIALASVVSSRPVDHGFETHARSTLGARQSSKLLVGVGSADITGPIGELTLFGYADLNNLANGIHLRVRARAFMFAASDNPSRRVVYISTDTGVSSVRTKKLAIQYLSSRLSAADAALYSVENVLLSATHTHSGPGGYQDDFLYQVTNWGRTPGAREAIANGVADAIAQAHADLSEGKVTLTKGLLTNGSINRSKKSYLANPASERALYSADVDQDMTLLAVTTPDGSRLRGVVNWFPVHGTSMNVSNHRVSGDNKGYASYRYELEQKLNGNPTFVAAFGQSNAADVSPNTEGAHCTDTGAECDGSKDSCGGNIALCLSRGPEYETGGDTRSTEVIGERQYLRAKTLVESPIAPKSLNSAKIVVDYRHAWVEYPKIYLEGSNTKICDPAMGYAFSAGTTDNPATGISYQGDNTTEGANKPLFNFIRNLLTTPSQELVDCHQPKQILLATGEMAVPYDWQPHTLPVQLFVITSKFVIIGFPAEISTMSGRRLRATVLSQLIADKVVDSDAEIVIAGLSNTYSSYVTTSEEYAIQRYEGGATTYGPNTLKAHQQIFTKLARTFVTGIPTTATSAFPIRGAPTENNDINLLSPVVLDTTPIGKAFGDVLTQPAASYKSGQTASAVFQCAHPRNGASGLPASGGQWPGGTKTTFMAVEKSNGNNVWTTVFDDALWDTRYLWTRVGSSESTCLLEWKINGSYPVSAGTYRFRIYGVSKTFFWTSNFTGVSNGFTVSA